METFIGAIVIFLLRVTDVSIGGLRVITMVRGHRFTAALLGFVEAGIFILAISRVFQQLDNPWNMLAYAGGFATGTAVGVTVENLIASGHILLRIISRHSSEQLIQTLRDNGFGVTAVRGEGREGERLILFVVAHRRRGKKALEIVRSIDPNAFTVMESVRQAIGGHVPHVALLGGVRK